MLYNIVIKYVFLQQYFVPCILYILSLNVVQSKLLGLKITPPGGVLALFMQLPMHTIKKV